MSLLEPHIARRRRAGDRCRPSRLAREASTVEQRANIFPTWRCAMLHLARPQVSYVWLMPTRSSGCERHRGKRNSMIQKTSGMRNCGKLHEIERRLVSNGSAYRLPITNHRKNIAGSLTLNSIFCHRGPRPCCERRCPGDSCQ